MNEPKLTIEKLLEVSRKFKKEHELNVDRIYVVPDTMLGRGKTLTVPANPIAPRSLWINEADFEDLKSKWHANYSPGIINAPQMLGLPVVYARDERVVFGMDLSSEPDRWGMIDENGVLHTGRGKAVDTSDIEEKS